MDIGNTIITGDLIGPITLENIKSNCPTLKHLLIHEKVILKDHIQLISDNIIITKLEFSNCKINDIAIEILATNTTITELVVISYNDLTTNSVLTLLNNNKTIKSLRLYLNTIIGNEWAIPLRNNTTLETLHLDNCCINNDGLIALAQNTNVINCRLTFDYSIKEYSIIEFSKNKSIVNLAIYIYNASMDINAIHAICNMHLQSLTLVSKFGKDLIITINNNPFITKLDFHSTNEFIDDECATLLAKNEQITNLTITCCGMTDVGLIALSKNKILKELTMSNIKSRYGNINVFEAFGKYNTTLESLHFAENILAENKDKLFMAFANNYTLRKFRFNYSHPLPKFLIERLEINNHNWEQKNKYLFDLVCDSF